MKGEPIEDMKRTLTMCLDHLPKSDNCLFNIISFGSSYSVLFVNSRRTNDDWALSVAKGFINTMKPDQGGTDFYQPLKSLALLHHRDRPVRNVFVFSDGQINDEQQVIGLIARSSSHHRVFTLGFGAHCR